MKYYLITNWGTLKETLVAHRYKYHLWLAHILIQYEERLEFAVHLKERCNLQVILDNGAYEGCLLETERYLEVCRKLKPWCIVAPDLVGEDAAKSLALSRTFYDRVIAEKIAEKVMIVPQGRTRKEVVETFNLLARQDLPDNIILGIGKCYELWGKDELARTNMFDEIRQGSGFENQKYHILGAHGWKPTTYYSKFSNVIGIDSVKPCRCAQGVTLYPTPPTLIMTHETLVPADSVRLKNNIKAFCREYNIDVSI